MRSEIWHSADFTLAMEPRTWPQEATRLEELALGAGVDPDELREYLYDAI